MKDETEQQNMKTNEIFGYDISHFSRIVQFTIGVVGVFAFYIIYGYLQERIFLIPGFKSYGMYLTWCQFIVYSLLAFGELKLLKITVKKVPWHIYIGIAILTVSTMGLSNTSVGYLNYPTQIIFKCCKLIPTMIGGILIQGIKYTPLDYISVLTMVIGLIWFILADSTVQPNFNMLGVLLISGALCADGAIGNVQEKAMRQYTISNTEMVLFSYSIGLVFISIFIIASQQIQPAFALCAQNPGPIYGMILLFSVSGYFGINFILLLVKNFGALPAVTVSTCRKAVTIILSFIFFKKPFTIMYVYSGLLVLAGIYMNILAKNKGSFLQCLKRFKKIFIPDKVNIDNEMEIVV